MDHSLPMLRDLEEEGTERWRRSQRVEDTGKCLPDMV